MRHRQTYALLFHALLAGLASVFLVVGSGAAALAHSELISSDPENGASLPSMPTSVTLTFNEDVDPNFAQVIVADGQDVAHPATAQVAGPRVSVPVPENVHAGEVEVRYRVVSADGHPVSGDIRFTVAGAAATSTGPSTGVTTPGATTPSQAVAADAGESDSTVWIYVLTGFAALLVVGVGLVIVLMGRRTRS